MSVGSGFIAARTTTGSPFVTPPSTPPARLVARRRSGSISSCASEPRDPREREAVADLDSLDRLDPHQRGGEPRVEPIRLLGVRAEAGRDAGRHDFDDSAERVAVRPGGVRRLFPASESAPPISSTRPATATPISPSSAFATAPAAT